MIRLSVQGASGEGVQAPSPPSCEVAPGEFDHEWTFQDDSFDHEFGTERVHYWQCAHCSLTRDVEPGDYDDEF